MRILVSLLFAAIPALAESVPCSASPAGDGAFVYVCQGLSKAQSEKIQAILNSIVINQPDLSLVLDKVGELARSGQSSFQFSEKQKADLIATARLAPGARVVVRHSWGDATGAGIAKVLIELLGSAGWRDPGGGAVAAPGEYTTEAKVAGFRIGVNQADYETKTLPNGAIPLSLALDAMGFSSALYMDADVPRGTMRLMVGNSR